MISYTKLVISSIIINAIAQPLHTNTASNPLSDSHIRRVRANPHARANQLIPVVVGGQQDTFVPNSVTAAVGDVIQFQFSNGNHTVTQSAEDAACQPLQATVAGAVHSGHIPYTAGQTTVGTFNMPITNTDTMFLYCATGPHCQEGQVMVINPTSADQIVNYAKLAAAATENVDGTTVSGGTVGEIPLDAAAFVPAAEEEAPPAAPAATSATSNVTATTAVASAATPSGGVGVVIVPNSG